MKPEPESGGALGAPPAALYDFLYRDSGRIVSYYAQIFGGHLSSLEEADSERTATDRGARVGLPVFAGDVKSTGETQRATKRVIDPHDVITTDVLSFLASGEHLHGDIEGAPHGSLCLTQGTLGFIDQHMLEIALIAFKATLGEMRGKAKSKEEKDHLKLMQLGMDMMSKLRLPSAFLLHTEAGAQIVGTIKEEGMVEPIVTYYFKHGTAGLSGVYLVGIKEVASPSFSLPHTHFIGAGQQAAQGLRDLLFPQDAITVTPVALFRKAADVITRPEL